MSQQLEEKEDHQRVRPLAHPPPTQTNTHTQSCGLSPSLHKHTNICKSIFCHPHPHTLSFSWIRTVPPSACTSLPNSSSTSRSEGQRPRNAGLCVVGGGGRGMDNDGVSSKSVSDWSLHCAKRLETNMTHTVVCMPAVCTGRRWCEYKDNNCAPACALQTCAVAQRLE